MKKTFQTKYMGPRATKHDTLMLGRLAVGKSGSSMRCGNVVTMCLYNWNSWASMNDFWWSLCNLVGSSISSTELIGWSALISTDNSCVASRGGVIGPLRIFGTWPHRLSVQYGRQYRFIIKSYKKNSGAYPTSWGLYLPQPHSRTPDHKQRDCS